MKTQELRLTGSGGQGLILAGIILAEAAMFDGKNVLQSQSYGPEARGGASRAEVIISDFDINYPKVGKCDLLLALTQKSFDKYIGTAKKDGVILVDSSVKEIPEEYENLVVKAPILESAELKLKKIMVANIVALGAIFQLTSLVSKESLEKAILDKVPLGTEDLNMEAFKMGQELVANIKGSKNE